MNCVEVRGVLSNGLICIMLMVRESVSGCQFFRVNGGWVAAVSMSESESQNGRKGKGREGRMKRRNRMKGMPSGTKKKKYYNSHTFCARSSQARRTEIRFLYRLLIRRWNGSIKRVVLSRLAYSQGTSRVYQLPFGLNVAVCHSQR